MAEGILVALEAMVVACQHQSAATVNKQHHGKQGTQHAQHAVGGEELHCLLTGGKT